MKAGLLVAAAVAVLSTSAIAGNYAYFDRPDEANANSHAAVSNDVYVRGFGWAWGDLRFKQDPGTATPGERQARDSLDRRDTVPGQHNEENGPPRSPRGKISVNLASAGAAADWQRGRKAAIVVR